MTNEKPTDNLRSPVRVIPLGGAGEIGMNCTLYEFENQILVVDCGVNFPKEKAYGIDIIIPSFTYLIEHKDQVLGVVLTHGHEDHIGAVPYLIREINCPLWGTGFTLELVKHKLEEHELIEQAVLHEIAARDEARIGPFLVEFIHVNHSIPSTTNLAIQTPAGTLIHATDFKIDYLPLYEPPTDLNRLAALGDQGVLCLLSDSTNVFMEGHSASEQQVLCHLDELIRQAPGRVIATMFASNLHRLQSLLNIADRSSRKVLVLGRSLLQIMDIGLRTGLLHMPGNSILIEGDDLPRYADKQVLVLTTGSQGEPRSALTQIAMDDHPWFKIVPGDTVIFSSRVIPGNEVAVDRLCDHLYRRGAHVIQSTHAPVHASGHAYQNEQRLVLQLTRPLFFVPIHGEYRHLARHALMAEELGVDQAFVVENGESLLLWEDDAQRGESVPAGKVIVDGKGIDEASGIALRDRKKLARSGIVVAWLVLDATSGEVIEGPRLLSHGVVGADTGQEIEKEAITEALRAIQALNLSRRREPAEVGEAMRNAVRRVFNRRIENKPVVVPIVHEL